MNQGNDERTGFGLAELAWEAEIERRLDAYRRGELVPVPSAEVFAKARALCTRLSDAAISEPVLEDWSRPEEDAAREHRQTDDGSSR